MKICTKCREKKPLDTFSKRSRNKTDGRQSICKECHKVVCRARYQAKKGEYRENNRSARTRVRRLVWEFLEEHPCIDCGESDPRVLEFDHVRGAKQFAVTTGVSNGLSWRKIQTEIKKCDVRCANCHRKKTYVQQGYWTPASIV